jgi:hypothetical protein
VRFGPLAAEGLPIIQALWLETPHSYERASYLTALLAIDPDHATPLLERGLFDCEADVRLFAVRNVRRGRRLADRRLAYLRDDPLESDELRGAAAACLATWATWAVSGELVGVGCLRFWGGRDQGQGRRSRAKVKGRR